jgi:hypothetical protein
VRSSNLRWFVLSQALGYSVLSLLHLRHSLPALEQGRLFIDLDYGGDANRGIAILQFLTLGYLFAIYALTLQYWSRLNLTVRGVSLDGGGDWGTCVERAAGELDGPFYVRRVWTHRRRLRRQSVPAPVRRVR